MLLLIDNYDSFTHILGHYLQELAGDVLVRRNDDMTLSDIEELAPEAIVISPGPGRPGDAGISLEAVRVFGETIPILGVCLGHQCIGEAFGGRVVRAGRAVHGRVSPIFHDGVGVFSGLPSPIRATRYHSLAVDRSSVPACLEVTAWTLAEDGELEEIMGLRHRTLPIEGVQFHPESILTENGHALLTNFLVGVGMAVKKVKAG
jgi:anthranilate synthase component 2